MRPKPWILLGCLFSLTACPLFKSEDARAPQGDSAGPTPTPTPPRGVSSFSNPKPELLCGDEGYRYLWTEFFRPKCGGCHRQGSPIPNSFGDPNFATALAEVQVIPLTELIKDSSQNVFCGPDCNLIVGSPAYLALEEWSHNPGDCP